MAENNFLEIKNIARQMLPRLIENLVIPNLIYKDYDDAFSNKGATIQVRKPVKLTATEFDENVGTSSQAINEESVDVTLNKIATVDMDFTAIQRATNVDELTTVFLEPAAVALAEKINQDGLALYMDIPYFAGTAGTTPSALSDFSNARKILNMNKVPLTQRRAIWDVEADAAFTQIGNLVKTDENGGVAAALREAEIGRVFGMDNYMSQAVKVHAGGSAAGTLLVDGAVEVGATVIHIDGATAADATVKKGDLLSIAGAQYVCTEDSTFGTNEGDVKVYPAVKTAIADNTAVAIVQSGTQNLVFHENAFAFVTRPLVAPAGVESYTTSYNNISMRVVRGYDMTYKKETLSMDVLYGYQTMYPELACRYLG